MIIFDNDGNKSKTQRNILEMSRISTDLWHVLWKVYDALTERGYPVRITSVFYPEGAFGSKSRTHPEFRALDIGARDEDGQYIPEDTGKAIQDQVNNYFIFPGGMKAVVFHGPPWHFHCQVPRK